MSGPLAETIYHQSPIEALAQHGDGRVQHVHSWPPVQVPVPALPTGGTVLGLWPVREWPEQGMWRRESYDSYAPPLFVLHDALVHSAAGIVCIGDRVIVETLAHTAPERDGYRALSRGIALPPAGVVPLLGGIHIGVLTGGDDADAAVLDGLARLSAVPDNYLAVASGLLVSGGNVACRDTLHLLDLPPSIAVHAMPPARSVRVETLVLPLSVAGEAAFHPCIAEFFRRVSANVPPAARPPRRLFIGNRHPDLPGLRHEEAVAAALAPQGFVPVRLDAMSVAEQVRLFRGAEAIVAVSGAGLANIGYARPGCVLVELMPDCLVNWRIRHLAALLKLTYDCVLGRARQPWRPLDAGAQTSWEVSVQHVIAAVARSLEKRAA